MDRHYKKYGVQISKEEEEAEGTKDDTEYLLNFDYSKILEPKKPPEEKENNQPISSLENDAEYQRLKQEIQKQLEITKQKTLN